MDFYDLDDLARLRVIGSLPCITRTLVQLAGCDDFFIFMKRAKDAGVAIPEYVAADDGQEWTKAAQAMLLRENQLIPCPHCSAVSTNVVVP